MKEYTLKKGDNGLWIIYERDNYFLAMKYRSEAEIVCNKLNSHSLISNTLVQYVSEKEDEIKNLQRKIWRLRQQLRDNEIEEIMD